MKKESCLRTLRMVLGPAAFIVFTLFLSFMARTPEVSAGVKVEDLNLYADFRFRYEVDSRDGQDEDRVRERIRLRPGFDYKVSDNVSFGARLSTYTDRQSPHSTLGDNPNDADVFNRDNIAVDKAFLKIKFIENGFVWFGKESVPFWEQNEAFWDADVNPEGIAAGYKFAFGPASLQLQGGQFVLNQQGFNKDDTALVYQGVVNADVGPAGLTVAYGAADLKNETPASGDLTVPGGEATYTAASIQVNTKQMLPIPVMVGYDSLTSDASTDDKGSAITARVGKLEDKGDWRVSIIYYDVETNSVPGAGALSQDDIQSSSNFKGPQVDAEYAFNKKFNIMLRYSDEEVKTGASAGQGRNRYQANLNAKF